MKATGIKKFFSRFGLVLATGSAGLLMLAYLAPFTPPDKFWPLSFFGLAYPYILLLNLIFLVYYILVRSKFLLIPVVAILIGYNHLSGFIQIIPDREAQAEGIKVLTYNVHNFSYDRGKKKTEEIDIINYLKKTGAEIICLQEASISAKGRLNPKEIRDALPQIKHYQLAHGSSYSGPVTFSKYPIVSMGEIRFKRSSNMVLFSDLRIGENKIIRVYNCHFQSYNIIPGRYSIINPQDADLGRRQLGEARELGGKLKRAFSVRAEQARKVAEHMAQCPYPVIVCGDFNDTPVSYTYRTVKNGLKDSFVESGSGISNSYDGILPTLRIDYIFHDERFKSVNYKREKVKYSDHFPVSCTLME